MFSIVYDGKIAVASIFDEIPHDWIVVDCRPLIDGRGNSEELIQSLLEIALEKLTTGVKVCFACDYGHSRSNYMAALAITRIGMISITDALSIVKSSHPDSSIKPTLYQALRQNSDHCLKHKAFAMTGSASLLGQLLTAEINREPGNYTLLDIDSWLDFRQSSTLEHVLLSNQITDVIHLAYPEPRNSFDSSTQSYHELIGVAKACLGSNVNLHYFSTWSVFEGSLEPEVLEDSQTAPFSIYSQARCLHEQQLRYLADSGGLSYQIYRLPCLLSLKTDPPRFLQYMADCAAMGENIYVHKGINGHPVVPLMDALNAARLVMQQLSSPFRQGTILHVCKNQFNLSVAELGRQVARKYDLEIIETPVKRNSLTGKFSSISFSKLIHSMGYADNANAFKFMDYMDVVINNKRLAL